MSGQFRKRHIRVFISSTFRDMQEERDLLVKRIFPELRKRCRQRELEFTEVDLRWGVTEEQAERGEVLPICLREIENSRPYFICLLGERYGWIPPPEMIGSELIEMQPWLAAHRKKSVTELEIIHGVLIHPEKNDRAFFYFRDPSYAETVDNIQQHDFVETDPGQIKMLDRLKQTIRDSGCRVRENYRDPHEAAEYILEDLWSVIDEEFPEGSRPEPLDREIIDHELYADTRRRVYIGREEYFRKLEEHTGNHDLPLVITGESGSGKSALIANWVSRYRRQNPETFIIQHYLGSSPQSANHVMIIRRIMKEIRRRYGLPDELPAETGEMEKVFPKWLAMAAQRGRMILILDGLNQLEDTDNARELHWLPSCFPDGIRVFISALPGGVLDVMNSRGWPQFKISPLKEDERRNLVTEYLSRFTKTLDERQLSTLIRSPQTGNPLFLKVLLDELRVFGIYEQLDELMTGYLGANNPTELYNKILARLENDYEQTCPGLVRDALSLIWASRRGLSEAELLDMLGAGGDPLPQAVWSPLFLAIEESLIMREGLLNFFHDYLRQAVYDRYIHSAENEKKRHSEIADYFIRNETDFRKADELPWQLKEIQDWDRLSDVMRDKVLLTETWDRNEYEAKEYWTFIEQKTGLSPAVAFSEMVNDPMGYLSETDRELENNLSGIWAVTRMLQDFGNTEEAFRLLDFLEGIIRDESDLIRTIRNKKATILRDWGRIDEALALYKMNEEDARSAGNEDDINTSLSNRAILLGMQGRLKEAYVQYSELEKKHRLSGDKYALAVVLTNMGKIIHDFGRPDEALAMIDEAEQLVRELGYRDEVDLVRMNKAQMLSDLGRTEEACLLLQQVENSSRQIGDREGLAASLALQAQIFYKGEQPDKALDYCKQAEALFRQLGYKGEVSKMLGVQANIINELGGKDKALGMHKQTEKAYRELGDMHSLAVCLKDQGGILFEMDKKEDALMLLRESARLLRVMGNVEDLKNVLDILLLITMETGPEEELPALYQEYEGLCTEMGRMDGLLEHLKWHSDLMIRRDRLEEALDLIRESVRILRIACNKEELRAQLSKQILGVKAFGPEEELPALYREYEDLCQETGGLDEGERDDLIGHLGDHADLMNRMEKHEEALRLLQQQEQLMTETGKTENLGLNLGNQGLTLSNMERFEEAMKLHVRSGEVFEEQGNMIGVSISYANQGLIYREWGRHEEALMMHEKEEALCRKAKYADGLIRSLGYQALALYELKRYKEALKLFREQEKAARKAKADIGELFSDARKLSEKELNTEKNKT